MPRVLVTGAGGFLGRALLARLAEEPDVEALPCDLVPLPGGRLLDATCAEEVSTTLNQVRPDWVIHLAGRFRGSDLEIYQANLLATLNIIEAMKVHCSEAVLIGTGSAAEYGHVREEEMPLKESRACSPFTAYGISKLASTTAILNAASGGLAASVVRPFNMVGPGMPESLLGGALVARMRRALSGEGPPVVETGRTDTSRDFVAVQDAADAYIKIAKARCTGEVFHICSGVATPIGEVLDILASLAPRPIEFSVNPAFVRPDDVLSVFGSCEKAVSLGLFSPVTPLAAALTAAWNAAQ
jgi:GDP-4-dehydro-6-deoxy-D-mannose reductase